MIRITNFGGLVPKASPRALPDDSAQVATDLQSGTREFRPAGQDAVVVSNTGITNPLSIWRLAHTSGGAFNTDMTSGWIVKAADMNFVRVQINNDTTDRTYATFNDGSAPMRVFDVNDTATGRQAGVPAPSTAPTVVVNVVDEFTVEERATGIASAYAQVVTAIRNALQTTWLGAPDPGTSTTGYVNVQNAPYTPPTQAQIARVYRLSSVNGANNGSLSNTYASAGVDAFTWVWDGQIGKFLATSNSSSPSWQGGSPGNYYDHLCIPFYAYGKGYTIDQSGLATALAAIIRPGTTSTPLLTTAQITGTDGIVTRMVNYTVSTGPVKPHLDALAQKVTEIKTLLDGGTYAAAVAQMAAFYAKSDVTSAINTAIANIASDIFDAAQACFLASTPSSDYPGGA